MAPQSRDEAEERDCSRRLSEQLLSTSKSVGGQPRSSCKAENFAATTKGGNSDKDMNIGMDTDTQVQVVQQRPER